MRKAASLAVLFLLALGPVPAQDPAEKALPANFRDWLDLVAYHIQPVEREVFLKLSTDREREIFVEAFWKQRGPTPGTPQNEFREELFSRFEHVNTYYGRSTSRSRGKFMKIRTVLLTSLLLLALGCTRLTLENYSKITMGMPYDEVTQLIGSPDSCDDVMGVRNCMWGNETRSVKVSFLGGKVMLFSSSNLN